MRYVYILKFKDNDLLKIGLASNLTRVLQHDVQYGIDLEKSYKFKPPVHFKASKLESVLLDQTMEFKPSEDVLLSLQATDGATEIRTGSSLDSILHLAVALKCEIIKGYDIKKSEKGITDQIPNEFLSGINGNAKIDETLLRLCKIWSVNNDTTMSKTISLAVYEFLKTQKHDTDLARCLKREQKILWEMD